MYKTSTLHTMHKNVIHRIMNKVYHVVSFKKLMLYSALLSLFTVTLALYIFIHLASLENLPIGKYFAGNKNPNEKLGIHFLNVGQGDAIYIQLPNKNTMLIDSGPPNEKVISEIYKLKNMFDRNINALLITHADADHIGSMQKIIENFNYQAFIFSGLKTNTNLFSDLMGVVNKKQNGEPVYQQIILNAGMTIILDAKRNIKFEVLFPDFEYHIEAYKNCKEHESKIKFVKMKSKTRSKSLSKKDACLKKISLETNLNSIVGRLSYGSTSFLLTGDAPIEIEKFLISKYGIKDISSRDDIEYNSKLSNSNQLQSSVLKLGHHGSKTSTSQEFLGVVAPEYIIVSAGKNNRYGHPHKKVLDNIELYKSEHSNFQRVLRTDMDGTINLYSDGKTISD